MEEGYTAADTAAAARDERNRKIDDREEIKGRKNEGRKM